MAKYLSDDEVFGASNDKPKQYLNDDEVFGGEAPKPTRERRQSQATALDYVKAIDSGLAEGVASLAGGVGTFIQDPAANTLSGVVGAAHLADRGITWALNKAGVDAQVNQGLQDEARMASRFAADSREAQANDPTNLPARFGRHLQRDSERAVREIQARDQASNPELVAQMQNMGQAEGFVDNLKAVKDNPLAFARTLARSAPDMAAGVGVGATLHRAGAGLGAVSTAGTLAEAGSSAMQARQGVYQQVADMPLQTLEKSPRFQEVLKETGGDATRARELLANELADQVPLLAGAGTAVGTVLTNKLFGGDATAKTIAGTDRMTAREFGKRTLQDTVEEGVQGVPEDTVQHGATVQADPGQEYDLGGSLAQNMAAGLAMGAGGHGYGYARDNASLFKGGPNGENAAPAPAGAPGAENQTPPGQAPAVAGGPAPTAGPAGDGRAAASVEAVGVGDTEAAERALREPVQLTALDRANEIDAELAQVQQRRQELTPENGYGPAFDQERAELFAKAYDLEQERNGIAKTWPKAQRGARTTFSTEAGVRLDGQYALMDAADLVTSHDEGLRANPLYPQELQPRDRSRQASELQVSSIVQKLDPARLGVSADAATGAPIVGADGLVESGNARTIALKRVYQANGQKAEDYKAWLKGSAAQFGIAPDSIDAMANPVLVRVRSTPVNRAEFARQANASTVQRMSPSEQALSDAKRLTSLEGLDPDDNGDFDNNHGFIRQFMGLLPVTEQSDMIESDGRLSTLGYRRIQNAVLAKAYGDSPTLRRMTESMDDNLRNISKALTRVAPTIAAARDRMQMGTMHEADIAPDLMAAVEGLSSLKDKGWSVADELGQGDLTGGKYTPEAAALLEFLSENTRSPRRIAEFVQRYYEALEQAGDPSQGSMFGDEGPAPTRAGLLNTVKGNQDGNTAQEPQRGIDREGARPAAQDGGQPQDAQGGGGRDQGDGQRSEGASGTGQPVGTEGQTADQRAGEGVEPAPQPQPEAVKKAAPRTADRDFWAYAKEQGYAPKDVALGTDLHTRLKVEFEALKAGKARLKALTGKKLGEGWVEFTEAAGTLGVPRADMPQIKAEHRGALTQFLAARGITHQAEADLDATTLRPTQVEFSTDKVKAAQDFEGGERSILISADSYVLDGHHQWLAKLGQGLPIRAIRFDAPMADLLPVVREFPSASASDGATLTAPTAADIEAQQDRAAQAEKLDARAQVQRESEAGAGMFELAREEGRQDTTAGLFDGGAPAPAPKVTPNTVFTEDAAEKARARLRKKLGQLNSGIDPETMMDGITLAGYHIEKGARTFAAYAKAMMADLGDGVKPYLKSWYMGVKYDPRAGAFDGMDSAAAVEAANIDALTAQETDNAASTDTGVERNREEPAPVATVGDLVQGDGRGTAEPVGQAGGQAGRGEGGGQQNLARVQVDGTTSGGKRGNQRVPAGNGPAADADIAAGADFRERGPDIGITGVPPDAIPAGEVADAAVRRDESLNLQAQQRKADATPVKLGDLENIRATLPYLLEGQQDDVHMAEKQFAKPDGYGMLFTNGTGTGKTFSGLGIVKRFARQGKTNTLIVVPDDKIAADWVESARELGLAVSRLESTKDAGKGIVVTTYANLGDNDALASRQWDLAVADEAHTLMQSADGKMTGYLENLRAITHHPLGAYQRYTMLNRQDIEKAAAIAAQIKGNIASLNNLDTMDVMLTALRKENEKLQAEADQLTKKLAAELEKVRAEVKATQGAKRTRAVFLSATPFAYEKTIDWANGYLFDYDEGRESEENRTRRYNEGDNREQFFMQHFGYTMRYNKLTEPDGRKVDRGMMQRQFNGMLKRRGSLAGRMLDVRADYDRRFVLVDSAVGNQIDGAIEWIEQSRKAHYELHKDKKGNDTPPNGYDMLQASLNDTLYGPQGHLLRRYLLEAIKAKEVVPLVKQHMAMGRKVVVFHDFKKGGAINPFQFAMRSEGEAQAMENADDKAKALAQIQAYNAAVAEFNAKFKELATGTALADLASPIERFKAEFPDVLLINGDEKKSDLLQRYKAFNDDAKGPVVAMVQSAKNKGWSGHDTTGKHPRVLFNLGLPTQPTLSIQQEGRIYRTGQVSNAMFRYLNTGTNWERWAFAQTIAERASAAENLGMGELARALKDGFITAFEESDTYPPGHEGEGTGGKERDKASNNALSAWDRAKSFYWGTQKKNSKTKAQEGTDYFATPEPLGLKMVEWLGLRGGEDALEPSAGHGAISRWLPDTAKRTVIEPSTALRSRLAMVMNPAEDRILDGQFEDLAVVNKFDGIAMNPPFGSGGRTAVDHLAKAATHLRDGGRIVALIPTGPAADKKFEKWFYETEQRPAKPLMKHPTLGDIYAGDTLKTRATWAPEGVVVSVRPDGSGLMLRVPGGAPGQATMVAAPAVTGVEPTGKRFREVRPAESLHMVADIKLPQVTFERAGTAVATRVVVIEKQTDQARAPAMSKNVDLTGITDINELFSRLEDMAVPARAMTKEQEQQAAAPEVPAPRASGRATKVEVVPTVDRGDAKVIEHTTGSGKVIRGIIRTDLTKEKAQEIDAYTFKKDGGWFIREKHLKPDTGDTRLSLRDVDGAPGHLDVDALRGLADRLKAGMPNMPTVHVLADPSKAPRALREYIVRQDAWDDVEGAMHDGELYLFASGLSDLARAEHVLLEHEAAHLGLHAVLGDSLKTAMNLVYANNAQVRQAATELQKRGKLTNAEAAEEVIVDIPSRDLARLKGWRKVVGMASEWMSQRGYDRTAQKLADWLDGSLSDQQRADLLVAELVQAARGYVAGKRQGLSKATGTRLSTRLAEDLAQQERWLQREAQARGYKDIEDLLERNYPLFEKLAELWRQKNPAKSMLSRAASIAQKGQEYSAAFKRWFGDWEAVRAQRRLDAMQPIRIKIPAEWRGLPVAELRERVRDALDDMVRGQTTMTHPELGEIRVGRAGERKTISEGRDPAKLLIAADMANVLPKSILTSQSAAASSQNILGFAKLMARVEVDGADLVAVFAVRQQADGNWYYNTTALEKTKAPTEAGATASGPVRGSTANTEGDPLLTEARAFSRNVLLEVNPDSVSKVVDDDGKPLVVFHGSENKGIDVFQSEDGRFYFTDSKKVAGGYGRKAGERKNAETYGVYLRMVRPDVYDMGGASWYDDGVGTEVRSYIQEAKDNGFDGVILENFIDGATEKLAQPSTVYVVFKPEQIKSATGNNGEFDPAKPDIRLSRTAQRKSAAERAEDILANQTGAARPLDAAAKAVTKLTGIERLTSAIYKRAAYILDRYTPEQIKAGVVSDYGVPQSVIDRRVLLQGHQRVQLRKAGELVEKLATLTREESRIAYEWMNMDGSDPRAYMSMMQGLPEESVKVLTDVQRMIDQLSQEAVRLGQLSPEAYQANKFAYLRRSYAKHIMEQTAGEKAKRARVISILGDQYKGRGLTETAPMAKLQNAAPDWWRRKLVDGKADTSLKGQKFVRLEKRAGNGMGTKPLDGMDGKGVGRLLEVAYWPADEAIPSKYAEWARAGVFEVRDVKGGNVVLWRDFTKEERETMGEVDEARFAIAKTLHGMIHDVEVGRYLEWMAHNHAKKEGETIPGQVVEASERMRDAFTTSEWVKVPETKIPGTNVYKYGKLAGRYLPGPVWNDLRQVVGGQFKPLGATYAEILSMWKTSKTALSPAVHMNNVMSNFVMADWHDVSAAHVGKALRIILAASQREGKGVIGTVGNALSRGGIADREAAREILNRYVDSGGDVGSWVTNEIAQNQLEPLLANLEKELQASGGQSVEAQTGVFAALQHAMMLRWPSAWEAFKPTRAGKVLTTEGQSLINLYQSEDDVFRLAAWLSAKEQGQTDIEAGRKSRASFLDYSINAPWIQAMRQTGWPFISFTYRAVPMLAEIAGKKPHKLLKLMALAGGLNALGLMMAGGGDEERKLLPEEKAGKIWGMVPKLIRMPWNDDNGSPVYLDIRRFIPVGDVFDVGQGHSAIPVLPGMQPGGPLVVMGEILLNKSMFTGKAISLETDTAGQQAANVLDYLYKAFAPNVLGLPNTYATTGVAEAAKGKTDAFGREQSVAQAVASSFGVKLGSYPADVLQRNLRAKAQAQTMEIEKNINQLKRQMQTNRITPEEYERAVQVELDKKAAVARELAEKLQ